MPELKEILDDKINLTHKRNIGWVNDIVGKEENVDFQGFQKSSSSGMLKPGIVWHT